MFWCDAADEKVMSERSKDDVDLKRGPPLKLPQEQTFEAMTQSSRSRYFHRNKISQEIYTNSPGDLPSKLAGSHRVTSADHQQLIGPRLPVGPTTHTHGLDRLPKLISSCSISRELTPNLTNPFSLDITCLGKGVRKKPSTPVPNDGSSINSP